MSQQQDFDLILERKLVADLHQPRVVVRGHVVFDHSFRHHAQKASRWGKQSRVS
jgi:hypothetical protein